MKMRLGLVFLSVVVLGTAGASAATARRHRHKTCHVPHTSLVLRSKKAEIRSRYEGDYPQEHVYYGCLRRVKRPFLLLDVSVSSQTQEFARLPRLAGRYAAFVIVWTNSIGDCSSSVDVYDLRKRRQTRDISASGSYDAVVPSCKVASLVLSTDGAAAWITAPDAQGSVLIRKVDGNGDATLDAGTIDTHSLTLAGRIVSWIKGGTRFSATLVGPPPVPCAISAARSNTADLARSAGCGTL